MRIHVSTMDLVGTLKFANNIFEKIPEDDEVIFDFSKISKFDPLPMLIMGTTIRNYRAQFSHKKFYIDGITDKSYAGTMGFFKYISELINFGKMPGEAKGSENYIPITPIKFKELHQTEIEQGNYIVIGEVIERKSSKLAHIIDRGNPELHNILTYLIREMLRNTSEHSQVDTVWICGQFWPSYELAEIAIADEGIGIYKSLTQNPAHEKYITDNETALKWALKAGISESFRPSRKQKSNDIWENSGFGLYMASEICKHLNGSFCIISYDNYMLIDNHGINHGKTNFHGTAIRMRIPSTNIKNANKIISLIANKGEEEAKTIRNAFQTASIPSKGLISKINID